MAIKDFENYFNTVKKQYFEMKSDLAEYEQMFKDGHITEDRLNDTKYYIDKLEENYNRLLYVETLIRKRNKLTKKQAELDKSLLEELKGKKADEESVKQENKDCLDKIKSNLESFKKGNV